MIYYAGIGSRKSPPEILDFFIKMGSYFAGLNFTLRSGGADGADAAFEYGCMSYNGKKEIYLPWDGFNNHKSPLNKPTYSAMEIASHHHPAWDKLKFSHKKLHARNVYQIFGEKLDTHETSSFVICWTDPKSGGTNQAIRIAEAYGVPVFNFWYDDVYGKLLSYIGGLINVCERL